MNEQASEPDALPNPSEPAPPADPKPARPPRRGVVAALALLLAIVTLAGVAVGGWQVWLMRQGDHAGSATALKLGQRVDALQRTLLALEDTQARQVGAIEQVRKQQTGAQTAGRSTLDQLAAISDRTRQLEAAVAALSTHNLSARDTMALDETAMLLRMAAERYELFHDGAGALKAYALATQTLATVDDPSFSGVRQTIARERSALAATHPAARAKELATLTQLRDTLASLPLRPLDPAPTAKPAGFWQRTWQALSHVISVTRDNAGPVKYADAGLTRELAMLDVAQAQAALLAHDQAGLRAALSRVDQSLRTAFDTRADAVQQARRDVARLKARESADVPKLGAALDELRNIRRVRDAVGQAATTAPAVHAADGRAPGARAHDLPQANHSANSPPTDAQTSTPATTAPLIDAPASGGTTR